MAEQVESTELVAESPHYDKLKPADEHVSSLSVYIEDDVSASSETKKLLTEKRKLYTASNQVG